MTKGMIRRGWQLNMIFVVGGLAGLLGATPVVADDPGGGVPNIGPDVVVYSLPDTEEWGASDGIRAYSVGTTSCNRGDEDLEWFSSTNHHPVIAQNLYRVTLPQTSPTLEHGKIEMLGISWLKHGFLSVNGSECDTCNNPGTGTLLGVGCSDPYGSWLNGSQGNLGPRSEVNAFTGEFIYPYLLDPSGPGDIFARLQVDDAELIADPFPPTGEDYYDYFVEGQYVAPDDAAAGNGMNNASYREVVLDANDHDLDPVGATHESFPAIYAWQAADPTVTIREVIVPDEGLFIVAYKVGDNGDGTWHYQYSIFNMNSHRSGRSFSVPILANSVVTNTGFRDVAYHSGEPWDGTDWTVDVSHGTGWLTWFTDDFATNPTANALRWSTMYNFSFDADSPPETAVGLIGLYRDGGPASVPVMIEAPANNIMPIFDDGFESGDTSAWSEVMP